MFRAVYLFPLFLFLILFGFSAHAADPNFVTVQSAHEQAAAGKIVLIDVRSEREWEKTGIPKHGLAITVHNPGGINAFVGEVSDAVKGDKSRPVALICAAGVRSTIAEKALRRAGYTNLLNVREGMLGNPKDGPGWLAKNLPVKKPASP